MRMIVTDPRTGRAVLSPEPAARPHDCHWTRQPTKTAAVSVVPSPAALELLVVRPLGRNCSPPMNMLQPRPFPQARQARHGELRRWYTIKNAVARKSDKDEDDEAEETTSAEVYIYGDIGESLWGDSVTAAEFVKEFDALDADEISVRINSLGGYIYEGIAILNALRRHRAKITVTVDGLAASAASFVAMGGDEVVMARNAEMMIHDGRVIAWGNAADLREVTDLLDRESDNVASIYAEKAGGTTEDWRAAMIAETWYSADEAVEAGLADRVDTGERDPDADRPDTDSNDDQDAEPHPFDLSTFRYAGRAHAPAPRFPARNGPPDPQLPISQPEKGSVMTDTADETMTGPADNPVDNSGPSSQPSPPRPDSGSVQLDQATYHQLVADAAAGREARNQQIADERARTVDAAVNDGRIPPARRQHWLDQLAADPGAEQVLNDLKPGLVPLEPEGYTGGVDESSDDDLFIRAGWGRPAETTQGA